ncbi:PGPGW domain-containing protein [Frankia sp. CNm7]|uniref:PGPGW domain-containing protein n=1 Tax=Frankia nepalensis TaxID=1836974 RepID=A0A937RHB5_9ACTN|nr:PGPGW domain-containing protein [Frankia nepalensis]MBL7496416.1 PGPGW domain-containing protein [Frankia nepalensis]MBL7513786.1 PGPGW domain-containing protein [Frankia nepalensis]MBL7524686.1 PGPGW domain-containing protein [Frankia nepalensis]MBL7630202.1 PGPGW domain-containing protein [Frankia nepalensis]
MLRSPARLLRRIVLTVLGVAILGLGAAMLVLPGPGFLVVALGFFVLGLEYDWARERFEAARQKAADLADLAAARVWSTAGSIVFGLGMVAAGVLWIIYDDLPGSSAWSGGSVIFGGLAVLATIFVSLWQARQARRAGQPTPAEVLEARRHDEEDADEAAPTPAGSQSARG